MADQRGSGISWTDQTWNPVRGCTRVSEGCRNCYAEAVAARFSGPGQPYDGLARMTPSGPRWTGAVRPIEEHLLDPLRWKRPRRVFVNSMSDLFHEGLSDLDIAKIFCVMALAPQHQFQILTKRPKRMLHFLTGSDLQTGLEPGDLHGWVQMVCGRPARFFPQAMKLLPLNSDRIVRWPLPNVWIGVSAEDQATAGERVPLLLETPAAIHWLSAEPLLGNIDLGEWLDPCCGMPAYDIQMGEPVEYCCGRRQTTLDWVVVGGESGPHARPTEADWAYQIRMQCQSAGVAFFMKQMDGKRKHLEDFPEELQLRQYPEAATRQERQG